MGPAFGPTESNALRLRVAISVSLILEALRDRVVTPRSRKVVRGMLDVPHGRCTERLHAVLCGTLPELIGTIL